MRSYRSRPRALASASSPFDWSCHSRAITRRRSPQKSAGGHILRRVVALSPVRRSASHGPSASNGNTQEERHQQRAKRGFARDVAQDAQGPAGLAAGFDRAADTVDRLCRHRSHDAWRQIRTSPPDTSGNSSGKAFSEQSQTCRQACRSSNLGQHSCPSSQPPIILGITNNITVLYGVARTGLWQGLAENA